MPTIKLPVTEDNVALSKVEGTNLSFLYEQKYIFYAKSKKIFILHS